MAELDARKESIGFLTKLFFVIVGVIIISVSGLITLLIQDRITVIFWVGITFVAMCIFGCFLVFKHIDNNIQEIKKL